VDPGDRTVAAKSASVAQGTVVYRDTFPQRGYRIVVRQPNRAIPATIAEVADTPLSFRDVKIRVTARRVAGPDTYSFGIVCRLGDGGGTFYALQVRSDGLMQIQKAVDGDIVRSLAQRRSGRAVPQARITASCRGGGRTPVSLTLALNGARAIKARDRSSSTAGAVGVLAQSLEKGGVVVRFDDFTVTAD
jgi:hypothetical protein